MPNKIYQIFFLNIRNRSILFIIFGVFILSLSDNLYFYVDGDVGIWQYHCIRSSMIVVLLLVAAKITKTNLVPQKKTKVLLRSIFNTLAIFCHFGGLTFLSVAEAGAGLFTAPIFVLIFSALIFFDKIRWSSVLAVIIGTIGVIVLLQPSITNFNPLLLFPIFAGFFYGLAIVTTKKWCSNESTLGLTACYYLCFGLTGFVITTLFHISGYNFNKFEGAEFFFVGWQSFDREFLFWLTTQSFLNVTAITLIISAYQKIDASSLSVYEYFFLIFAAFWGWVLWSQTLTLEKWIGIVLIVVAGVIINAQRPLKQE